MKYMLAADDFNLRDFMSKAFDFIRPHVVPVLRSVASTFLGEPAAKAVDTAVNLFTNL